MSKAVTAFIFVVYAVGFLIVAAYFLRYNYISINLLKARYVSAGIMYVTGLIFVFFIIQANRIWLKILGFGRHFLSLFLVFWIAIMSSQICLPEHPFPEDLRLYGPIIIWYIANYILLYGCIFSLQPVRHSKYPFTKNSRLFTENPRDYLSVLIYYSKEIFLGPYRRVLLLFVIVGLLMNLVFFSFRIYQFVPTEIGGGRPTEVQIIFENSEMSEGLPFTTDTCYTEPLSLLDQTDRSYLFLINLDGENKLFEMDKELVKGVIYGVEDNEKLAIDTTLAPADDSVTR